MIKTFFLTELKLYSDLLTLPQGTFHADTQRKTLKKTDGVWDTDNQKLPYWHPIFVFPTR
jgi:hypothetical protein